MMKSIIWVPTFFAVLATFLWLIYCFPFLANKLSLIYYFIVALVVMAGVFSISYSVDEAWNMRGKRDWPETTGVITNSTCETSFVMDHNGPIRVERHTLYAPKISYHYEVDATTYNGTGISDFNIEFSRSKEKVDSILRLYPVGKKVSVYYSPQNPAIAVLEKIGSRRRNLPLIVGALLLCMGLCCTWVLTVSAFNKGKSLSMEQVFTIPEELKPLANQCWSAIVKTIESHPVLKSNLLRGKRVADQIKAKDRARPCPPLLTKSELNDEISRINKEYKNSESQRCNFLMLAYWKAHYYNEALAFSEKVIQNTANDWEKKWYATQQQIWILTEADRGDEAEKVLRTFAEKWGNEMKKENISLEEELQRIRTRPRGLPPK
jgi:hypothetical protein